MPMSSGPNAFPNPPAIEEIPPTLSPECELSLAPLRALLHRQGWTLHARVPKLYSAQHGMVIGEAGVDSSLMSRAYCGVIVYER